MAEFEGVGFPQLDELLSDQERLARDTVRDFVSMAFLPRIQEHVLILGEAITGMRAI